MKKRIIPKIKFKKKKGNKGNNRSKDQREKSIYLTKIWLRPGPPSNNKNF